jgi:riboflavin kinase / FMN adenylyltransferase
MYRIKFSTNQELPKLAVATIGNFDGLHPGHLELLSNLKQIALDNNYRKVVITFEPLPLEYFADIKFEKRLTRLSLIRDKIIILRQQNLADELVILRFDASIANLSPQEFIQKVLQQQLDVKHVVIGHDFKFGKNGTGNINDFKAHGIESTVMEPYYIENERVSSSLIRHYATGNDLRMVAKYLGRNLHYTSHVIYGNQLGRKFGVPTINLGLNRNRPALWGIYTALVHIEGKTYNAVASIGKNPTVSIQDVYKLEAHLLDVDLDLYGKIATVEILSFMREERKFDDMDKLFKQIYQDLDDARRYFSQHEVLEKVI